MEIILLICAITCSLAWFYWYRRPDKFPPGPRGLPFVGTLLKIGNENMGEVFLKWKSKYGPVMSARIGNNDWVVLNNFDVVHKALVRQGTIFSGREITPFLHALAKGKGIAFMDYGDDFKVQRKFGILTLRGFGVGKSSMEDKILEEMEYLTEILLKTDSKPINAKTAVTYAVSNVTCNLVFGRRFEYDDKAFKRIVQIITESFAGTQGVLLSILNLAFWMRHLPLFRGSYAIFKNDLAFYHEIFSKAVKDHKCSYDENNIRDFIDAFIKEMLSGSDTSFDHEQLLQYIRDLFEAGTETTSTTIQWSLLAFLHFPECQDKIRAEIDEVIGDGNPMMKHQKDMPYTSAFIHEVMRHGTLVPTSIPHKASETTELEGYVIPKNTPIFVNLWAVHNDPALFPNPREFNPQRFIDADGKFVKSPHVIPFSVGPRHCLGQQLANMELFIFITRIVQLFEIIKPDGEVIPDLNDGAFAFTYAPKPFNAVFKPRN